MERVIGESQAKAGEQLARLAGLNEEQTGTFVDHYRDCPNSRQEAAGTAKGIEGVSGALLYALSRLGDPEELKANQDLELIWLQLSDIRAQERDMEVIERTIIPMADEAAGRIMERWADEAARILDRAPAPPPALPRGNRQNRSVDTVPRGLSGRHGVQPIGTKHAK